MKFSVQKKKEQTIKFGKREGYTWIKVTQYCNTLYMWKDTWYLLLLGFLTMKKFKIQEISVVLGCNIKFCFLLLTLVRRSFTLVIYFFNILFTSQKIFSLEKATFPFKKCTNLILESHRKLEYIKISYSNKRDITLQVARVCTYVHMGSQLAR